MQDQKENTQNPKSIRTPSTSRLWGRFLAFILFFIFFIIAAVGWYYLYTLSPGPANKSQSVVVEIPKGASVREIAGLLDDAGVIKEDPRFLILARLSGYATRLQAGEFLLETGRKPQEILVSLATSKPIHHLITIPEGLRATEIAAIFEARGWVRQEDFLALVKDPLFIKESGLGGITSLEGFLYPDTYALTRDMVGAKPIAALMVKRFYEVWNQLVATKAEKPDLLATVILASMVEKEAAVAKERGLIAGVFANRLEKGMRLQSDPTVVYGIEGFTPPITKKDLRTPHPYNTYIIEALPAGPIANPGRDALAAALEPEATDAIFFVAKNDGTHHFSRTLREHNQAVQKYQRKKNNKKGNK